MAAFDDIFTEILTMADALADGIVAQFPDRFSGQEDARAASTGTADEDHNGAGTGSGKIRFHPSLGSGASSPGSRR